ncbi:DUF4280 domain-containing protein [Streptobacillus moniliformis]|uniref:DUF4280 domain-containing protein n=1 Tax=Streptobacillus moniliformis TaxID=34105 RepID=UPI0007E37633|nr:DUF4280 domain-containing protein [Streptobacillus moniliformis]
MELKKFEDMIITQELSNFFDKLADIFLLKKYNEIDDINFGRYKLSKLKIEEKFPNTDFDYLVYTKEGHIMQDELIIITFRDLMNELNTLIDEFDEQEIYIDKKIKYLNKYNEIEFKDIKSKNPNLSNINDYRSKNIKINLGGILSTAHVFGSKRLTDFLKNRKHIYLDENNVPITEYFAQLGLFDISTFFKKKDEDIKVVVPIENDKDNKIIKKLSEKDKKDFFGQDSKSDISSILEKLKDPSIIKGIIDLINASKNNNKDKNSEKNNNNNNNNRGINNSNKSNRSNDNTSKKIVKSNKNINDLLREKYNSDKYKKDSSKYIENTTNRNISEKDKEDINNILNMYEEQTKDENGVGDTIKQKGYDDFRDVSKKKEKLNIEDMIYLILKNNRGNELNILEKSLEGYSCRYIKESFTHKFKSISKNIFLSKVSDLINMNLRNVGINYKVDLSEYNYLNYGKKDIDDISLKGDKRILDYIKLNNLVKSSFSLDSKDVRIYPRSRRLFDNILIKYIKNRIRYKKSNFDGIDLKDLNLSRNTIIFLDELTFGLSEEEYNLIDQIGNELNITKLIIYLLKNKFRYSKKILENINSNIDKTYDEYMRDNTKESDKSAIKNIFPTKISLEKHCELKGIRGIYFFYKSFYDEENNKILNSETIATTSVLVKCNMCPTPSKFIIGSVNTFVKGDMILTDNDKLIATFPTCAIAKVCSINILGSNWQPVSDLKYGLNNALLLSSKINCSVGGIISLESTTMKNLSKSKIKTFENNEKNDSKINSPFKTKDELIDFLDKRIISFNSIYDLYDLRDNRIKFVKKLYTYINESKKILSSYLSPKYVDRKITYDLAIYDNEKIIDMSDIMDVIKQYFDSFINRGVDTKGYKIFKKYGKNINANKFLEEYLISKNSISATYDYETNQVKNEAIWIKYLLKEYNRYKFRKRNVKLNEEFKRKIVMYHKIGGGIDANSQIPWCSSFVNWILDVSGIGSFKTASSQQMINKLKRIDKPLYGSILIFTKYNKNNEATGHGHITFLMGITDDKKQYICLGGNQEREIKYSKYYLDKKMGVKGGYFKLNGIFWPPDYPDDKIDEIK